MITDNDLISKEKQLESERLKLCEENQRKTVAEQRIQHMKE